MKVVVYYNPYKRVFVAKTADGNYICSSYDFSKVDREAHKVSQNVCYDFESMPYTIRAKLQGYIKGSNTEHHKLVFMQLVLSYRNLYPPDKLTRKIARIIAKRGLRVLNVTEDCNTIRVDAGADGEKVTFIIELADGKWSFREIRS